MEEVMVEINNLVLKIPKVPNKPIEAAARAAIAPAITPNLLSKNFPILSTISLFFSSAKN